MDAVKALEIGGMIAHIKQYQVLETIGEGGMGWVYRAHDSVLDRDVAIKVMKPNVPERERNRFRGEALFGARFAHPGIARVLDLVGVPGQGVSWFAMEYLPGRDLERVLQNGRSKAASGAPPLPMRLLFDTVLEVLDALQYAHDCGVVHRDVKPANILLTRDPNTRFVTTKLVDFGLALDVRKPRPPEEYLCGDPRYMAPEQTVFGTVIDARADLYALGVGLFELVTGHHPFADLLERNAPTRDLLAAHRERPLPRLSDHVSSEIPRQVVEGLDAVCQHACAKDPTRRFAQAKDVKKELARLLAEAC